MVAVAKKSEPTAFGRRLRELREQAGLTQSELGERAGKMMYQMLARYERGETEPTWPVVLRLAEALGVSTEAFREVTPPVLEKPDPEPPKRRGRK